MALPAKCHQSLYKVARSRSILWNPDRPDRRSFRSPAKFRQPFGGSANCLDKPFTAESIPLTTITLRHRRKHRRRTLRGTSSRHGFGLSVTKELSHSDETSNMAHTARLQLHFRRYHEATQNPDKESREETAKHFAANFATSRVSDEYFRGFRRKLFATREGKQRRHEVTDIYSP